MARSSFRSHVVTTQTFTLPDSVLANWPNDCENSGFYALHFHALSNAFSVPIIIRLEFLGCAARPQAILSNRFAVYPGFVSPSCHRAVPDSVDSCCCRNSPGAAHTNWPPVLTLNVDGTASQVQADLLFPGHLVTQPPGPLSSLSPPTASAPPGPRYSRRPAGSSRGSR